MTEKEVARRKRKQVRRIKTVIFLSVGIIALVMVVFFIVMFVKDMDKKSKETKKNEQAILDNFEEFKEDAEGFSIEWSTYNKIIEPDINANTVYQYDGWILSLDSYTEALDKLEEKASIFKDKCINHIYSNPEVKHKCTSFYDAYEKSVNSYIVDIEDFNNKIKEINEKNKSDLKEYELKYKKVDINNDKIYSEIIVESE